MKIESPLDMVFLNGLRPRLAEGIDVRSQVEIETFYGPFRVDFLIKSPDGNVIAIECDGKEFHDYVRDEIRDALILDSGKVNIIYRISGHDIYRNRYDHLYWLYKYHPGLFSKKGIEEICSGAGLEPIWEAHFPLTPSSESREYWGYLATGDESDHKAERDLIDVSRFEARLGANRYGAKRFGTAYVERVRLNPGKTLDEIAEAVKSENRARYSGGGA